MSDIAPIGRSAAAASYSATRAATTSTPPPAPTRGSDRADISDVATILSRMPDVRQDLVERVRGEIAGGTYVTDEKIDKAIDSLLEDLA